MSRPTEGINRTARLALFCSSALLAGSLSSQGGFLPNNIFPNPGLESGTNLDQPDGIPTGWTPSGSDPSICQVTTNNSVSGTHALIVNDTDPANYGEWYSDLSLAGLVNPGDALQLQYYQMYSIQSPEMRVTVLFFDSSNKTLSQNHYTVTGDSPGWAGSIEASTFTKKLQSLVVPAAAVSLRVSVVSGGPSDTTGLLVVDDISLARSPTPSLLKSNFWPNATFELGTNLADASGTPTGWSRGGSSPSICQVTTNNYVSASHALELNDLDPGGAGEWSSDLALSGLASAGDALNLQWFELYSITNGQMELAVRFLDASSNVVQETPFSATGQSPGWQGAIAGSGFTRRSQALVVPAGSVSLRIALGSGSNDTTGVMLVDDISLAFRSRPVILAGNFWPNPQFELGTNLNQTNGVPDYWAVGGSDPTICQVITNNYTSSSHALALLDGNTNGYGEWDADLLLGTNASPGDLLDIQWSELHKITNGTMRVSVLFYDAASNAVGQTDVTLTGQSGGWQGSLAASTFVLQKQQVLVPNNAQRLRIAVVSGGDPTTTGVLVLDDLSIARHVLPPTVLAGNFFPNPTFEDGVQLDDPTLALPVGGWQRGGSDAGIDQVLTNNWTSPSHALALVDQDESNYGEWYLFLDLTGHAVAGDALDLQWLQLFNTTNGNMRLSFAFLDSSNNALASQDFSVSGQSSGWNGSLENSVFETQFQRLAVPDGATQLRVNFASGGSASVTGVMLIDDLSVRLSKPYLTDLEAAPGSVTLTWNSMPDKSYTILFSPSVGPAGSWVALASGWPSGGLTTSYQDTRTQAGPVGFYRVIQE